MNRIASLLGLASMLGAPADAGAGPPSGPGPLRVTARAEAGPHFVGQAIEIRVEVEGASGVPAVDPPGLVGVEVRPVPGVAARPAEARFVAIARRAGTVEIPPFRARSGDRSGASRPIRLSVANVPAEGRTSAFLGGVGALDVRAEAGPTALRAGQTLDYLIRISGPAAWGSTRAPDLSGWSSVAPGLRVEPLPDSPEGGAVPARTFRYRLRPTRAGRVVLPPVAVSAFDPKARRYATRYTAGIAIRVEDPPGFDPSRLDYGGDEGPARQPWRLAWIGPIVAAALAGGLILGARWRRSRGPADPIRVASGLIGGLVAGGDEPDAARRVTEALAEFLHRAGGRSPGALTPPETRAEVERLTLDRGLALRAGSLVEDCDRARFGGRARDGGAGRLIAEGRAVLESVAGAMARGEKAGRGPREAVETAGD